MIAILFRMVLFLVVPQMSSPIFSLDSSTGELFVDGSGPHLDANGTSGFLNVSNLQSEHS